MIHKYRTLKRGDGFSGTENLRVRVREIQSHLHRLGYDPGSIDGLFGKNTERFVRAAQLRFGMVPDGVVRKSTWDVLENEHRALLRVRQQDLQRTANRLGVPLATIRAVDRVESRGTGFRSDGRPHILYERHVFRRNTKLRGAPSLIYGDPGGYSEGKPVDMSSGAWQWERLMDAYFYDPVAALRACSWGRYQVLGENAENLGYSSVFRFVEKMMASERAQLEAFARFIEINDLDDALREKDWAAFARSYNGPSYADNNYDTKLAHWHSHYS